MKMTETRQEADRLKFGALATPYSVDWDDDGDEDLIAGNTAGYIGFIENLDSGHPPKWGKPLLLQVNGHPFRIMAGDSGSIQGPAERKWGYTTLTVADWDHDGLKDIIFNSIWGKVHWLRNTGTKGRPVVEPPQPVFADWPEKPPKPAWNWWNPDEGQLVTQWRTTPFAMDWNHDGLTDLIVLDHEGYLCFYERFEKEGELLLKPGKRIFYTHSCSVFDQKNAVADSTGGPLRLNYREAGASGRRKLCFADWDRNFIPDLLVGAEDGHFYYLKNKHIKQK